MSNTTSMDPSTAKVVSTLTLGIGSLIAGTIPICITAAARQLHPLFLSCLFCFGGGVLLATSVTHMLPESRERLPDYSELAFCIGFFIVYLMDELSNYCNDQQYDRHINERQYIFNRRPNYGTLEIRRLLRDGGMRSPSSQIDSNTSDTEPCDESSSGAFGLMSALFVHSILEGIAIGLQETTPKVLLLLAAVSCHKFVVGFCLGTELLINLSGHLCTHIICIALFSSGSMVGIGLGAGFVTVDDIKNTTAVPVTQALAGGSLLYVTLSEVLPRERARWRIRKGCGGLLQLFSVGLGFTIIYLSTIYLDYD